MVSDQSHFEFYLFSNKEIHPVFHELLARPGIKSTVIQKGMGFYWLNRILPELLEEKRIDLFWGTLQMLPVFKMKTPSVVNYHDLNFKSAPKTMTLANYWQHRLFSGFSLKNAEKVFCLSQNTLNDIKNYQPNLESKLVVVYPGAAKIEVEEIPIEQKQFIFTIGTLEPRKNLTTLIAAFRELKEENPNFPYRLVLAGRLGWGQEELSNALREGHYSQFGIDFIENPEDGKLAYLLRNCAFFVFPSIHEGFGLPIIEAMREGKTCIASNIPVFREILEDKWDLFVDPLDISGWKKAILEMGTRPPEALRRILPNEKWTWESTAKILENELLTVWYKILEKRKQERVI